MRSANSAIVWASRASALARRPERPGEIPDLPWVDHRKRQLGAAQRRGDGDLEAAGRLEDDQGRLRLIQTRHQLLQAGMVTGHGEGLTRRQRMDVEAVLGDIAANEQRHHGGVLIHDPSL
jgi:hypothetical protein